jgi:hypothetical protein
MTVILNSKKLIFIHIHKCAGTSVELVLGDIMQWNDIILGSTRSGYADKIHRHYREEFGLYKHSYATDVKRVVGDEIWKSYFSFSIVRHPLDRMISIYEYLRRFKASRLNTMKLKIQTFLWENKIRKSFASNKGSIQVLKPSDPDPNRSPYLWPAMSALLESKNFSDFIVLVLKKESELPKDFINEPFKGYNYKIPLMASPQVNYLLDENGADLAVNFIAKIENLDKDWNYVCEKLNISLPLTKANKSPRTYKDWRKYYSLDELNLMMEIYKSDMEFFNYSL